MDYLLLKDNLFITYVDFIKHFKQLINENGKYIKSDIDEQWALFLSKNVDKSTSIRNRFIRVDYTLQHFLLPSPPDIFFHSAPSFD